MLLVALEILLVTFILFIFWFDKVENNALPILVS